MRATRLPGFAPFGDHHGHIPVLTRGHLHALEIEEVLAGFQVVDVERADDLLPLDHVTSVDRSLCGDLC